MGRTCFSIQRSAFQSTLPARGATLRETLIDGGVIKFQSTLPARGATILIGLLSSAWYFNPRSPHGERLASDADVRHFAHISIHAPRTGSDRRVAYTINRQTGISIHAPRTGSDNLRVAREAVERHDFNPRSPHGERRAPPMTSVSPPSVFQSTLPARGATDASHSSMRRFRFQSTLPARGATFHCSPSTGGLIYFNPRSPHGERPELVSIPRRLSVFQSTLPARGATTAHKSGPSLSRNFNPRSPHGERRCRRRTTPLPQYFNPRSPHGERRVKPGGFP